VSLTVKTQHDTALLLTRNKLNSKSIYSALQKVNFQEPRISRKHPGINFEPTWKAVSYRALNPQARDLGFKIVHEILPTKDFLRKYVFIKNPKCCLCKSQTESIQHIFKLCPQIKLILNFYSAATDSSEQETDLNLFQLTNEKEDLQQFKLIVKSELALEIWKTRNRLEKKQGETSPSQLLINSKNALKNRISLDYYIQGEQDFRRRWCGKPLPITISCNQVIFGF
jgi:hypothetical protein